MIIFYASELYLESYLFYRDLLWKWWIIQHAVTVKACHHQVFNNCSYSCVKHLPALIYVWNDMYETFAKTFLKENLFALKVLLCVLISRPGFARTRAQLRGNIDFNTIFSTLIAQWYDPNFQFKVLDQRHRININPSTLLTAVGGFHAAPF